MITLDTILSGVALIGVGITIGLLRSIYLTKSEHRDVCALATAIMQREIDELQRNREAVWTKIDQIYDWMVTGVVQINRREGQ